MDYEREINELKMEVAVMKSDLAHGLGRLEERIASNHGSIIEKLQQLTEAFRCHTDEHKTLDTEKRKGNRGIWQGVAVGIIMLALTFLWQHIIK